MVSPSEDKAQRAMRQRIWRPSSLSVVKFAALRGGIGLSSNIVIYMYI